MSPELRERLSLSICGLETSLESTRSLASPFRKRARSDGRLDNRFPQDTAPNFCLPDVYLLIASGLGISAGTGLHGSQCVMPGCRPQDHQKPNIQIICGCVLSRLENGLPLIYRNANRWNSHTGTRKSIPPLPQWASPFGLRLPT